MSLNRCRWWVHHSDTQGEADTCNEPQVAVLDRRKGMNTFNRRDYWFSESKSLSFQLFNHYQTIDACEKMIPGQAETWAWLWGAECPWGSVLARYGLRRWGGGSSRGDPLGQGASALWGRAGWSWVEGLMLEKKWARPYSCIWRYGKRGWCWSAQR